MVGETGELLSNYAIWDSFNFSDLNFLSFWPILKLNGFPPFPQFKKYSDVNTLMEPMMIKYTLEII